jgi:Xaa-Pro dipeptidase
MDKRIPASELRDRMNRFRSRMDQDHPGWEWVMGFSKINQYYFTGTMQDGMLIIPRTRKQCFGFGAAMNVLWMSPCSLISGL